MNPVFDPGAFIQAHTHVLWVPSVPSIRLYQADEVTPLWLMTESDLRSERLAPPYWAFAWSGGQALARYVLEHPDTVRGRRILDIACGSGLVGIAAMQAGAAQVICNDIDPLAGTAVALNAALNGVSLGFTPLNLLVDSAGQKDLFAIDQSVRPGTLPSLASDGRPEVILAGDICYEKSMTDAMLAYFTHAVSLGIRVYIGDPHRSYFPKSGLRKLADYDIVSNADIEDAALKNASVWQLEPSL